MVARTVSLEDAHGTSYRERNDKSVCSHEQCLEIKIGRECLRIGMGLGNDRFCVKILENSA